MVSLTIVIPVHNQSTYTHACLASLIQHPPSLPFEVIIVDDGSTDDTGQVVTAFSSKLPIRLIENTAPHRFARACNRGSEMAQGELLLLLNNDTELLPGWFEPLYRVISIQPDIGIVVPRLIFPDGTIQHCGKVWADISAPDAQPYHLYYRYPATHPAVLKSRDFQTVTGACMLVRTADFRRLGGFEEAYENGWEDDDLCAAYRAHAKRIFYCAESCIIHHQNKTLNERMVELEKRLPDRTRLQLLDQALASGFATPEEIVLAQATKATFDAMEHELLSLREKFRRNRDLFFSRWGASVVSDLFVYTSADGILPADALGEQIVKNMQPTFQQGASMPLVSIIILTFNRLDVTKVCLESIQRNTPESHEIIVVDNGSSDDTVAWLHSRMLEQLTLRLIENDENRGFSAGCNQGIQTAQGEYLLLLNNDTVVTPGWLSGLLECLADRAVGVVGPMTNNLSGIQQWPWCDYQDLKGLDGFATLFREQHRYWWIPSRRIVGFCMLFRRTLVEQIGLLDEQFGSGNFEDDDFCLRAALFGYHNRIAGDVFIHHEGSATFRGNQLDYRAAMMHNHDLFQQKWSKPVVSRDEAVKIICLKTLEQADLLCRKGVTNQAVELLLQEGIRQIPEETCLYHALAEIFLEAAMPQEAFDVLLEAPEDQDETSLLKVQALIALGRVTEASKQLELVSGSYSGKRALVSGILQMGMHDHQGATAQFLQALELNPVCAGAYSGLADLSEIAGNLEAAFRLREQAATCVGWNQTLLEQYHAAMRTEEQLVRGEQILRELRHCYPDVAVLSSLHIDLLLRLKRDSDAMSGIEDLVLHGTPSAGLYSAALQVRSKLGTLQVANVRKQQGIAVSLCMIVKDEERTLAACLASVKPLVDEMIVVDTGSTDATRAIAEIFGALVIEAPWTGDFSVARNCALELAQGNWILSLDADEVISPLDYDLFRHLVADAAGKSIAYTVTTRNYTNRLDLENWQANYGEYPNEEAGRGWMPSDKVRIFPNRSDIRFENPIHEMVEPALDRHGVPMKDVGLVVHHYGYLDDQRQQRKKEYYYELGKRKYQESGGDPGAIVELAIQAAGVGRYDEAIELWQMALAIDPDSYLAWFNLGHAYLQKGVFQQGSTASQRAMTLRDNYREAVINTAICEVAQGNVDRAIDLVSAALPRNPDYPILPLMSAILMALQGERAKALQQFRALQESRIEFHGFIHEVTVKLVQGGQIALAHRLVETAEIGGVCEAATRELMQRHTD
jgi:GT2 family glycosyltransferase/tetratricopeptide (TPR) repeat protein